MWTFYNGENQGKLGTEGGGLYWTTEDLKSAELHAEGENPYSQESVLSYRYNPSTGEYSVIENRAWVNQIGQDGYRKHNALAQLPFEHGKPAGTTLGTYDTYEEAQTKYNEVKTAQKGYIYMGTAQTK